MITRSDPKENRHEGVTCWSMIQRGTSGPRWGTWGRRATATPWAPCPRRLPTTAVPLESVIYISNILLLIHTLHTLLAAKFTIIMSSVLFMFNTLLVGLASWDAFAENVFNCVRFVICNLQLKQIEYLKFQFFQNQFWEEWISQILITLKLNFMEITSVFIHDTNK